jgi:branched-chain amino acid aminotransferase
MKRVWLNTKLIKGKLPMSSHDRGMTLGDGLFETLAVRDGVALWRFEHTERMRAAADATGIPFPETEIENGIDALSYKAKGYHVLRLTLTRGEGGRGLAGEIKKPTLIGTLDPFDGQLRFQPVKLITSAIRRNLHSPGSHMKTLSYMDNVLAAREAAAADADDALMLNSAGRVACSTVANIFAEKDGALITPALAEGILPGVMRAAVIRAAKQRGIQVKEKQVKPADAASADGFFLTNSLRFIRPVAMLDGKRYGPRSKIVDELSRALLNAETEQLVLS